MKYQKNLKVVGSDIYSYNTLVGQIIGDKLHKVKWEVKGKTSSTTTSKHINYNAYLFNLTII